MSLLLIIFAPMHAAWQRAVAARVLPTVNLCSSSLAAASAINTERFSSAASKAAFSTVSSVYTAPFEEQRKKFYASLEAKPWAAVSNRYITEFKKEEDELMRSCLQLAGLVSPQWQECQAALKDQHLAYVKDTIDTAAEEERALDHYVDSNGGYHKCATFVRECLAACAIDPRHITIIRSRTMPFPMGVIHTSFFVNPKHLSWIWSLNAHGMVVFHEIQHILHNDEFDNTIMKSVGALAQDRKSYDALRARFCRFQERRADILASLINPQYAQAGSDLFAQCKDVPHAESPLSSERAKYLKKLHQEMIAGDRDRIV